MTLRGRQVPALDGVRALAVLAVIAYHLGFGWASGGYLGVDLFFVLSGFLITSLLLEERLETGSIGLAAFWGRRARRLLPGLLLMLVVLGGFIALFGPGPLVDLHQVRTDAIATVLYVANWHQLFAHQSYFDQFAAPSPLQHTWSLGIEEQFYVIWPLAVVGLGALARRRRRLIGGVVALLGAVASASWMAWLATHGASINRMYYGTDTRAFDLLIGAVLAYLLAGRAAVGPRPRRLLAIGSPVAIAVIGAFWWRAGGPGGAPSRWMFEWGFLACAVAAAIVLADAGHPEPSPVQKILSFRPLVFVGTISYELYLWHWPVICELTPARLGFSGAPLDAVRLAATFALSVGAFFLVDNPIRRWAFKGWPSVLRLLAAPAGMVAASAVMVAATVPVASAAPVQRVRTGPGVPGVPGAGGSTGGPIHLLVAPSRAHPLRVILFGDSVMRGEAPAVAASLGSTGTVTVDDAGFDGWGLTTDKGWRTNVPGAIRADHAQLVVAMWSFDDDFLVGHRAEYRRWLSQFVRLVVAQPGVAGLVFEEFPPIGPPPVSNPLVAAREGAARNVPITAWNTLARSLVALDPSHVTYLPLGPAVERSGKFDFWLPPGNRWKLPPSRWIRVRSVDAVHFCPAGAARYAAALFADLATLYHLPRPAPDWSTGAWTQGADYGQTTGNCPADHPA